MNSEIITVGTELLLGQIVDTNFAFLGQKLAEAGINVFYKTSVGDNEKRISEVLKIAMARSDIIIITGGLGPTVDDVTRAVLVKTLNLKLVLNERVLEKIKGFFDQRKAKMSSNNVSQALVPSGAAVIENPNGTAPGLILTFDKNKYIIVMPGVPGEMKPMMVNHVIPFLKENFKTEGIIKSRVLKCFGLGESKVDEIIGDLFRESTNPTIALLASYSQVIIRLTAKTQDEKSAMELINRLENEIRSRLKDYIFAADDETMEKSVSMLLTMKKLTLSTAESCTGGLISSKITDVPGASDFFIRGIIAYSNIAKVELLGVREISLNMYGAVSRQVCEEMAEGIRKNSGSDIGLSITGIAGPSGGTAEKPVGLCFIGLCHGDNTISQEFRFSGDRLKIKEQAAQSALDYLRRYLLKI